MGRNIKPLFVANTKLNVLIVVVLHLLVTIIYNFYGNTKNRHLQLEV